MPGNVIWSVKQDNGAAWSALLRARVATETQTFARATLQEAQDTVAVLTGETKDSGMVSGAELAWMVLFGGAALYLEYGTHNMSAQPFLTPAYTNQLSTYLARLAMTTQGRVIGGGMITGVAGG